MIEVDGFAHVALRTWAPKVCDRLRRTGADIAIVDLTERDCTFAVDEYALGDLREAARAIAASVRADLRCARISVSQRGACAPVPSLQLVGEAMARAGVHLRYVTAPGDTLSLFVGERDVARAQSELAQLLGAPGPRRAS